MSRRKSLAEVLHGYAGSASGMATVLDEAGCEKEAKLADALAQALTKRAEQAEEE